MAGVNFNPDLVTQAVRRAAMRGIVIGTERIRSEAINLILNTQKTGRLYFRSGLSKLSKSGKSFSGGHRASAPGEPPASDTGNLVRRIDVQYDRKALIGYVVSRADYSVFLEYGTQRMAARPFMRPAAANCKDEVEQIISWEIKLELESIAKSGGLT